MSPVTSNPPMLSLSLRPKHRNHPSQEHDVSENSPKEDQISKNIAQNAENRISDDVDFHGPSEHNLISKERPQQVPNKAKVTILSPADAVLSSRKAAHLQPHLPPFEWSFWKNACLRGPKPAKLTGYGFCVVHRRLDNSNPGDQRLANLWWQSCFTARNVHGSEYGAMFAVAQALEMAVGQCERISGIAVTKARIKMF